MCQLDLADCDFPSHRSGESARARQIASPPGPLWRRAALELRRSRGPLHRPPSGEKQAGAEPAQAKAGSVPVTPRLP
ncbi:hypothetical protein NDU88_003573 [Pleurodeles waltl]|uniref:Uncharacterized protein n=1 Tax=Pleurodeles waltl TaxID=8319 RepID=A0AAV7UD66_PLEWA|nr:hypothetical protein NDU88_003573 [Pleurodeles waltl]